MEEETLVVVKPDGVERGLTGRIIAQFEDAGLRLARLEYRMATRELVEQHYPSDPAWLSSVGQKTVDDYDRLGRRPADDLGVSDPEEIGRLIKSWLIDYLTGGPVVAMVLEGNDSVATVRKMCGHTLPVSADPGSIRGRYSTDSAGLANLQKRPVRNLVHASGNLEEARHEIALWFG